MANWNASTAVTAGSSFPAAGGTKQPTPCSLSAADHLSAFLSPSEYLGSPGGCNEVDQAPDARPAPQARTEAEAPRSVSTNSFRPAKRTSASRFSSDLSPDAEDATFPVPGPCRRPPSSPVSAPRGRLGTASHGPTSIAVTAGHGSSAAWEGNGSEDAHELKFLPSLPPSGDTHIGGQTLSPTPPCSALRGRGMTGPPRRPSTAVTARHDCTAGIPGSGARVTLLLSHSPSLEREEAMDIDFGDHISNVARTANSRTPPPGSGRSGNATALVASPSPSSPYLRDIIDSRNSTAPRAHLSTAAGTANSRTPPSGSRMSKE